MARLGSAIADYILENGPTKEYKTYVVKAGESLSSIAAKLLGDPMRWQEIFKINSQISNPNVLSVGQTINVPAEAVASSTDPAKTLPGPLRNAVETEEYDTAESSDFLSSPMFLVGAAGVALLIILMATKRPA